MFPDEHFAFVLFQTKILSISDAQQLNNEYKSDSNYSSIEYLLLITRNCIPEFKPNDLGFLSDFYNEALQTDNHKKIVWLVDSPKTTALAHLFVSLTDGNVYCSTIQQAYTLLDMPMEYNRFLALLNN
jgi:hypothetical protein